MGVSEPVFPEVTSEFVVEVVDNAPRQLDESDSIGAYLGALDGAVSDRSLSFTEAIHLKDLAGALAVYEAEQDHAHRIYVRTLAATAWADHRITEEERADLTQVGKLLDLSEDDVAAIIDETQPAAVRDDDPIGGSAEAAAFVKAAQRALSESRNGDRPTGTAKVPSKPSPRATARSTPVPVSPARPATGSASVPAKAATSSATAPATVPPKTAATGSAAVTARAAGAATFEPGWYPDPNGEARLRWYDGDTWTDHTHD